MKLTSLARICSSWWPRHVPWIGITCDQSGNERVRERQASPTAEALRLRPGIRQFV